MICKQLGYLDVQLLVRISRVMVLVIQSRPRISLPV